MALFKSQIVTQASGSVGGMTFSHNASGMYMRARTVPVNPATALQQVVRNAQSTLSQAWSSILTDDQRAGWSTYAKNVKVKNKQGDQISLSGLAMFSRCNVARIQATGSWTASYPTIFTLGDPYNGSFTQASATPWAVTTVIAGFTDPEANLLVYVSQPQSPTINFFKGPFQFNITGQEADLPLTLIPNPNWAAGQKIFIRTRFAYPDGRMSGIADFSLVLNHAPLPPETLVAKTKPRKAEKAVA